MNATDKSTRPLTRRRGASAVALAAWAEAMIAEDVSAQVDLGVYPVDADELRRNIAVALVESFAHHLGLRVVAVTDEPRQAAA